MKCYGFLLALGCFGLWGVEADDKAGLLKVVKPCASAPAAAEIIYRCENSFPQPTITTKALTQEQAASFKIAFAQVQSRSTLEKMEIESVQRLLDAFSRISDGDVLETVVFTFPEHKDSFSMELRSHASDPLRITIVSEQKEAPLHACNFAASLFSTSWGVKKIATGVFVVGSLLSLGGYPAMRRTIIEHELERAYMRKASGGDPLCLDLTRDTLLLKALRSDDVEGF